MHGAVHIEAVCGGGALLWFFISYTGKRRRKRHTRHKKQNSGMRKRQQSVALNKNREEAQRTLENPMPSLRLESSQNLGEGGGLCSQNMGMLTNKTLQTPCTTSGKLIVCSPFTKPVRSQIPKDRKMPLVFVGTSTPWFERLPELTGAHAGQGVTGKMAQRGSMQTKPCIWNVAALPFLSCFFIGPHGFVSDAALGIGCGIAALHYLAPDVLTVWDQLCGGMIRIVCSPMFLDNRCGLCHERLRILLPLLKKHITCSHTTLAVMYVYNQAMTDLRAGDVTIRAALGLDEVCVCFVWPNVQNWSYKSTGIIV